MAEDLHFENLYLFTLTGKLRCRHWQQIPNACEVQKTLQGGVLAFQDSYDSNKLNAADGMHWSLQCAAS